MVKHERGDVVSVAGGTYASKPRPVLILQGTAHYTGDSVVVIPFTSVANDDIDFRIEIKPSKTNGLDKLCYLEIDKISSIRISAIGKRIGRLEDISIVKAEKLLATLLEL